MNILLSDGEGDAGLVDRAGEAEEFGEVVWGSFGDDDLNVFRVERKVLNFDE